MAEDQHPEASADSGTPSEGPSGSGKEAHRPGAFGIDLGTDEKYLYAAIALTLMTMAFWTVVQFNAYNSFHLTVETALSTFSLYYLAHFPGLIHGFQFLVIATHIAPDQLLVLPLFYLFPSALTLMLLKVLVVSLSGLLAFFIARDMTKSPKFSLALLFAYFINPGTINILFNEYHVDLFLIPFYLLTFYFCMKLQKKWFYASLILLLGVFESGLSIVACLGLGIIAYEYLYDKEPSGKAERMRLGIVIVGCTVVALLFYNFAYYQVQSTSSATFPPLLALPPYPFVPLFSSASYNYAIGNFSAFNVASYAVYAAGVMAIGFGMVTAMVPAVLLIFSAPWLGGVFILHNSLFLYAWRNSYVLPGALICAILGYGALMRIRPKFPAPEAVAALAILAFLLLVPPLLSQPQIVPNQEMFLSQFNQSELQNYHQLSSIAELVPENASLMTQMNLLPYFTNRRYIETTENSTYYFQPEYILWDGNLSYGLFDVNATSNYLYAYLNAHNYSVASHWGNAFLVKQGKG